MNIITFAERPRNDGKTAYSAHVEYTMRDGRVTQRHQRVVAADVADMTAQLQAREAAALDLYDVNKREAQVERGEAALLNGRDIRQQLDRLSPTDRDAMLARIKGSVRDKVAEVQAIKVALDGMT